MKIIVQIIAIFWGLMGSLTYAEDRIFSLETMPVDVRSDMWDFSDTYDSELPLLFRMYVIDSLMMEYWKGNRQWYKVKNDMVYYIGEWNRNHRTMLNRPVPTSAFGASLFSGRDSTDMTGHYCGTFEIDLGGTYECSKPIKGSLKLSDDYMLDASAISETRSYFIQSHADSIDSPMSDRKEVTRTRWFLEGDPFPVAIQISEKEYSDSRVISSESHTFVLHEWKIPDIDSRIPLSRTSRSQRALDESTIVCHNGIVYITGDFPENLRLTLSVSNIQGTIFSHEPTDIRADGIEREYRLPDLPPGKYILTVSAGTPTDRKVIVTI
ncbi:MAG: hypothetical protein NC411_06260 [Bacteroides sp.]|nr:hypothetical protein [Bacteroides sp.]